MNKIIKTLFLSLFVITSVFVNTKPASAKYYPAGTLLKIKGVKGAAVYQIGSDGRKYVYPDQKTFNTWHDDFSDVLEVALEDIDSVDDGGTVTFQPGTRLITHQNTAKVYAVGEDGQLTYIPNEDTARKFYGNLWYQLVLDIDPGVFAIAYKIKQGALSDDNLPEGSLIEEEDTGDYYIIEDGQRRKVLKELLRLQNLIKKQIIKIKRLSNMYDNGDDVDEDDDIEDFEIGAGKNKVLVCHKPELVNRTISVSERALKAHLAHGDYRGTCEGDTHDDDDEDSDEDDDDDTATSTIDLIISDIAFEPSSPTVNATTTITAYVKNSGTISLTNYEPIFNVLTSLGDYHVRSVATSTVSVTDPLVAGESATIVWDGYFPTTGEKVVSVTADYADNLDEDNEDNNTRIESVNVNEEDMVDISVYDILVNPSSPTVNATTTITVQIKNTGNVSLTDTTGLLSYQESFENFQVNSTSTQPIISESAPFDPDEILEMTWTGYFDSTGEKVLSFAIDQADQLEESDETNNAKAEDVTVQAVS